MTKVVDNRTPCSNPVVVNPDVNLWRKPYIHHKDNEHEVEFGAGLDGFDATLSESVYS